MAPRFRLIGSQTLLKYAKIYSPCWLKVSPERQLQKSGLQKSVQVRFREISSTCSKTKEVGMGGVSQLVFPGSTSLALDVWGT